MGSSFRKNDLFDVYSLTLALIKIPGRPPASRWSFGCFLLVALFVFLSFPLVETKRAIESPNSRTGGAKMNWCPVPTLLLAMKSIRLWQHSPYRVVKRDIRFQKKCDITYSLMWRHAPLDIPFTIYLLHFNSFSSQSLYMYICFSNRGFIIHTCFRVKLFFHYYDWNLL